MKHFLIMFLLFFTLLNLRTISVETKKLNIFSNLPAGEYQLDVQSIFLCNPKKDSKIRFNFYAHKKSNNSTEIKGNITSKVALDDSMFMDLSMSYKDAVVGWKDNLYTQRLPKACSSFKRIMGKAWFMFMDGFGIYNATCPIPAGVFTSNGVDISIFEHSEFPKTFIYGQYKIRFSYNRNNEIFGCNVYIVELKRP